MDFREEVRIQEVQPGRLLLQDGSSQDFDECLWCTQASAPPWLQSTGLQLGTTPPAAALVTSSAQQRSCCCPCSYA